MYEHRYQGFGRVEIYSISQYDAGVTPMHRVARKTVPNLDSRFISRRHPMIWGDEVYMAVSKYIQQVNVTWV